jgi:hypothetical protein
LNAPFLFSAAIDAARFNILAFVDGGGHFDAPASLIKARMSSARQAVVLGPSLTGWGYFPDFTPAKNDDRRYSAFTVADDLP